MTAPSVQATVESGMGHAGAVLSGLAPASHRSESSSSQTGSRAGFSPPIPATSSWPVAKPAPVSSIHETVFASGNCAATSRRAPPATDRGPLGMGTVTKCRPVPVSTTPPADESGQSSWTLANWVLDVPITFTRTTSSPGTRLRPSAATCDSTATSNSAVPA